MAVALVAAAALVVMVMADPGEYVETYYPQDAYLAESRSGWGWQPSGWGSGGGGSGGGSGWGWKPKVKYLKFTIPIPQLPRIRFGIKGGLNVHASVKPKGWGWSK